jgi:hypothetical protein
MSDFKGTDYDNDHCLVVVKVRERLLVSKRVKPRSDMERFYLKRVNNAEVNIF